MMQNKKSGLPSGLTYVYAVTAAVVLAAVFAAYSQPDFLVLLANQVWLCF